MTKGILRPQTDTQLHFGADALAFLEAILARLGTSPQDALADFEAVGSEVLGRSSRVDDVVAGLARSLPSGACRRILAVIERWGGEAAYRSTQALSYMAAVYREGGAGVTNDVREAAARLLARPEVLSMLPVRYDDEYLRPLRLIWAGARTDLFDRIAGTLTRNLDAFTTDTLYRWVGELVHLLDGDSAAIFYDYVAARAVWRIPNPRPALEPSNRDSRGAIAHAIGTAFVHPRVEFRFRALYAAVELILEDASFVAAFVAEMNDDVHPRYEPLGHVTPSGTECSLSPENSSTRCLW